MSNNNSNCMKRGAILVRIYVKSTYYFIHARTDINVCIVYEGKKESVYLAPNGIDIKTKINMNGTYMHIMLYYVPNGWIVRWMCEVYWEGAKSSAVVYVLICSQSLCIGAKPPKGISFNKRIFHQLWPNRTV